MVGAGKMVKGIYNLTRFIKFFIAFPLDFDQEGDYVTELTALQSVLRHVKRRFYRREAMVKL
jgi:hypothetical protein